jgi:hypothetical protein
MTIQSVRELPSTHRAWKALLLWFVAWAIAGAVALKLPHDLGTVSLITWTVVVAILCLARPVIGMYLLVAASLFVEQNDPTNGVSFFNTQIPFFWDATSFTTLGVPITPAEVLLAAIVVGWAARWARTGRGAAAWRTNLIAPTLCLLGLLVVSTVHGFVTGGDIKVALWEVRGPFYTLALVVVLPGLLQRVTQLKVVTWLLIVGTLWAAAEGLWVAGVVLNWDINSVETLVGHDDAVHIAMGIVLLVALLIHQADRVQRLVLLIGSPLLVGVLLATRRRDAIIAVGVGLAILAVMRIREHPRDLIRLVFVSALVLALAGIAEVTPIGRQLLDQPVRAVTSAFAPTTARDEASNQYREAERRGLRETIRRSPIVGVGFGQQYDVPSDVFYIGVPLYRYITHDDLLRFWAKTGTIGFIAYWMFYGAAMLEGVRVYRRLADPWLKAIAAFAVCVVAMQLTVHSVDMAMTFYRSMIVVGIVVGMLLSLERVERRELARR